jgi:hypothetical protein
MAEGGYDTASYVYDVEPAAHQTYGTPNYWIRYFSPAPNGTVNSSSAHANAECRPVWDSGAKHLVPITSPSQSRLSGSAAMGQADAQTVVSAIVNVYGWVVPLHTPANNILRVWLDQESSTSMSTNYWEAWANYINHYNWFNLNVYPLFACLYCNPCHGAGHNCTSSKFGVWWIWASEPQTPTCSFDLSPLPAWNALSCSSCVTGAVATSLWQFRSTAACHNLSVNVDLDEGTQQAYSFYLSARP